MVGIICIHGKMDTADFKIALATRGFVGKVQMASYTYYTYLGGVI